MECSTTSSNNLTLDSTVDDDGQLESFVHQEYVTQYLGFTPNSFINGGYNAMSTYIDNGVKAMEDYIMKEYGDIMTASQLQEASQVLVSRMTEELDKAFDILQIYSTKNIFHIPPHVVLPGDSTKGECQYTEEDERVLDGELQELKDKIIAIKYANSKLQQELKTIDRVQAKLDQTQTELKDQNKISVEAGVSDPQECVVHTASSIMDQIKLLHSMASKDDK